MNKRFSVSETHGAMVKDDESIIFWNDDGCTEKYMKIPDGYEGKEIEQIICCFKTTCILYKENSELIVLGVMKDDFEKYLKEKNISTTRIKHFYAGCLTIYFQLNDYSCHVINHEQGCYSSKLNTIKLNSFVRTVYWRQISFGWKYFGIIESESGLPQIFNTKTEKIDVIPEKYRDKKAKHISCGDDRIGIIFDNDEFIIINNLDDFRSVINLNNSEDKNINNLEGKLIKDIQCFGPFGVMIITLEDNKMHLFKI